MSSLEPFLAWSLATEGERQRKRLSSSMEEIQTFYGATRFVATHRQLYHPLFLRPQGQAVWLNDDGREEKDKCSRLLSLNKQGKIRKEVMDFQLSPEHEKIHGVCRELAQNFATQAAEHDREVSLPLENYAALRGAGLYGLTVPKEYGGMGGDFTAYTVAMEEIAQGCPVTALTFNMHVAFGGMSFMPPVADHVSLEAKQRVANIMIAEKKLVAAGLSEPGVSSLLLGPTYSLSMQTRRVDGGYRVTGRKSFQSMLEASDYVLLITHPEDEPQVLELPGYGATRAVVFEDPDVLMIELIQLPSADEIQRAQEARHAKKGERDGGTDVADRI